MKLSLQLLYDRTSWLKRSLIQQKGDRHRLWRQILWYLPGMEDEEEVLLYGAAEDFPDSLCHKGLICLGKPSDVLLANNQVLFFETNATVQSLFGELQKIFLLFERWEEQMVQVIREGGSLEDLLQLSVPVFENPVFVHDENFTLLASVNEHSAQHEWQYDTLQGGYILPPEIQNDFKVNKDYLHTMHTTEPSIFPEATFGYRILYQNLWKEGVYQGRICVNELQRKLQPGDNDLLNFLSGMVLEERRYEGNTGRQGKPSLSRLLTQIIEKEGFDTTVMDHILMQYEWTAHDAYFCVCFFPEERDVQTHSLQYFCGRLTDALPDICAFPYQKTVVALVNSTVSGVSIMSFRNRLAVMLREGLIKMGISSVCRDLYQFRYYYQQTVCAYETGILKQDTFWSYCFDDYQTDYVLEQALAHFPGKMLCSREILDLQEYDRTHTAQLAKTLRVYLENDRNLTRTSQLLGIHRSTLLYRLDKMQEVTQLGLEQPKTKFRLLLSFNLLDEWGGKL